MEKQSIYRTCEALELVVCTTNESVSDDPYSPSYGHTSAELFIVSIQDEPPWSFESPPGSGCFCGISITILAIIGQKLGLRLSLQAENPDWPIFTTVDGTRYAGGMAEMLLGAVNMTIRSYSLTAIRKTHYDMVSTCLARRYSASVHQRWLVESGNVTDSILYALFATPMADLWPILLLAMICTVSVSTWIQYVWKQIVLSDSASTFAFGSIGRICLRAILNVLSSFFSQDDIRRPKRSFGAQTAVIIWLISAYFTTTLMCTYVRSSLAGSQLTPPFRTMLDSIHSNFSPLLFTSGTTETEFMSSSALKPLLKRVRRFDFTIPFDTRIRLVADMSRRDKLVVFHTDENPLYEKVGFIPAIPSVYYTLLSLYQMPLGSRLEPNVSHIVKWMAATGILERVIKVHKNIIYRAYGISFLPGSKPLENRQAASIRLDAFFSTGYTITGLFSFAGMVFLAEIIIVRLALRSQCISFGYK